MDPQLTLSRHDKPDAEPLGSLLKPDRLSAWAWTLGYTALLSTLSVLRYNLWIAEGDDLGLFRQGLWLIAHRGLLAPSTYTGHPILADAASYILVLLAPLYQVGGVGFLLVLQAFAFGLGYLFIRRIAEQLGVDQRWAHVVGVVYLLYPTVLGANLFDFHPDAFGIPILLALIWAAVAENWLAYGILLVVSLLVKDTVPILLLGTGAALLLQRRPAWGVVTLAVGALGFALDALWLIPNLTHGPMVLWGAYYGQFGATPQTGIADILTHPQLLLTWVRSSHNWEYLVWILGPVGVFVLIVGKKALNPWWIPVLLFLETNLLSSTPVVTSPFNELSVLVLPFLFGATLVGLQGSSKPGRRQTAIAAAIAVAFLVVFAWHDYHVYWTYRPPNTAQLAEMAQIIPKDAPVVAPNFIAAHFADRSKEWLPAVTIGQQIPRGTYVILDSAVTTGLTSPSVYAAYDRLLGTKGTAVVVFSQTQVTVYRLLRPITPTLTQP